MKRLYIVRHGKSSWKDDSLDDFDRPLNKRGKKAAPEMGKRLKKRKVRPDLLLSSPAVRAITTARIIAKEIGYLSKQIATDEALYGAGTEDLIEIIRRTDDDVNTLMIFGHNPGFTCLARALTGEYILNLATCAVYCVDFELESWNQIDRETGTCSLYDYPKKAD